MPFHMPTAMPTKPQTLNPKPHDHVCKECQKELLTRFLCPQGSGGLLGDREDVDDCM